MTLSDEIISQKEVALFDEKYEWIEARKVKEFIKLLKEDFEFKNAPQLKKEAHDINDKHAGEKLT